MVLKWSLDCVPNPWSDNKYSLAAVDSSTSANIAYMLLYNNYHTTTELSSRANVYPSTFHLGGIANRAKQL